MISTDATPQKSNISSKKTTKRVKGPSIGTNNTKGDSAGPARSKIVIRRLPAALPESIFWKSVEPWIHCGPPSIAVHSTSTAEAPDVAGSRPGIASHPKWSYYRAGKVRARRDKDDSFSRAYIAFQTPEALVAFNRAYDGWNFKSKSGRISQAVVEFAPNQRSPLGGRIDPRQGTIDTDPDFLAFCEALTRPVESTHAQTSTTHLNLEKPSAKSTPLLDHLRTQKQAAQTSRSAAAQGAEFANAKKGKKIRKKCSAKLALPMSKEGGDATQTTSDSILDAVTAKKSKPGTNRVKAGRKTKHVEINGSAPAPQGASTQKSPLPSSLSGGGGKSSVAATFDVKVQKAAANAKLGYGDRTRRVLHLDHQPRQPISPAPSTIEQSHRHPTASSRPQTTAEATKAPVVPKILTNPQRSSQKNPESAGPSSRPRAILNTEAKAGVNPPRAGDSKPATGHMSNLDTVRLSSDTMINKPASPLSAVATSTAGIALSRKERVSSGGAITNQQVGKQSSERGVESGRARGRGSASGRGRGRGRGKGRGQQGQRQGQE